MQLAGRHIPFHVSLWGRRDSPLLLYRSIHYWIYNFARTVYTDNGKAREMLIYCHYSAMSLVVKSQTNLLNKTAVVNWTNCFYIWYDEIYYE